MPASAKPIRHAPAGPPGRREAATGEVCSYPNPAVRKAQCTARIALPGSRVLIDVLNLKFSAEINVGFNLSPHQKIATIGPLRASISKNFPTSGDI
jgi:hypothetical protein